MIPTEELEVTIIQQKKYSYTDYTKILFVLFLILLAIYMYAILKKIN